MKRERTGLKRVPKEEWNYLMRSDAARKQVRDLKRIAPYLFHEHAELVKSKRSLDAAKIRYAEALKKWKELAK